jgi:thiol-disulfide isomerase/thioredoxin
MFELSSVNRQLRLVALASCAVACLGNASAGASTIDTLQSFDGGSGWINSAPLTPEELRGKVVLVDFWEYTCINCLRTMPYLREWYRRYRSLGFTIVGVHTPEFDFSGKRENVEAGAQRLGVTWPVVLDDHYTIWKRYNNNIWPRELLYDQSGRLVESVSGEGGYQQTEARIQALLKQADPKVVLPPVMALLPQDSYTKPGAVCYPMTAEIVLSHQEVANGSSIANPEQDNDYAFDGSNPQDGAIYLAGYWHRTSQAVVSAESHGSLTLRYHAIQLVAVMRPEEGRPIRVDVTQNGAPVARSDAGKDLRYDDGGNSYVDVTAGRAYDLIMNARFGQNTLKLSPKSDGLGFYDFAFESCEVPKTGGRLPS